MNDPHSGEKTLHIGYLTPVDRFSEEHEAAIAWLRDEAADVRMIAVSPARLVETLDVLWVHFPDEAAYEAFRPNTPLCAALRRYVEQGGRLLLTNFAAYLPHDLGFEMQRPEARPRAIADEGFGRAYGFQSFRGHPLLKTFHGGGALWHADADHTAWRVGYFGGVWPAQGQVVGVEKSYITIHSDNKLLVEYTVGAGQMVSVGAFVHLAPKNYRAQALRRFLHDALRYLARSDHPEKATYWVEDMCAPRAVAIAASRPVVYKENNAEDRRTHPAASRHPSQEGTFQRQQRERENPLLRGVPSAARRGVSAILSLTRDEATDAFFDVAGRRCLMMGRERGGIDEVWVHPIRVLRDLEIGLVEENAVRWLCDVPARVEICPEAIVRTYQLGAGTLTETVTAALDRPGGLIHLHADGAGPLRLLLRFRVDLRWMWPFPDDALGALHFGYDDGLNALHVHDHSCDFYALFGSDHIPEAHLGGAFAKIEYTDGRLHGTPSELNQVYQAFVFILDETNQHTLHFAIARTDQGRGEAEETFRALLRDPSVVYDEAARHYQHLLETKTMVTTPDPALNEGYRWAVVGTERFRATTPGLGTGLMAGYGTASMGWNGGHVVSGRPGYAWYFGRDAAWAGLAVCAYGGFEAIRQQLHLFRDFQDESGKILHEMTTSGSVHYDAADATPLYVILAAHYARASGDLDTLRALWPSLRQAMDFLFTTDTDGDGLIENTNVGHGWIEGGPLFGAHTTLYLTALWAQTLRDAAYLATVLDQPETADAYDDDAQSVLDTLHRDFWNDETRFVHHSLRPDGTFAPEPTVLAAVPMLFGLLSPARSAMMLDTLAGNDFSTDWGMRLLPAQSPLFDPESYHGGTVWPLFTGWTALAEYIHGRPAQGFARVMNTLLLYRHHALGWAGEVFHGTHFEARPVCPHQCWSETGALHPILAGLVGFHPDAPRHRLRLQPRLPLHWNIFRVDNLWMGHSRLHLTMHRTPTRTTYHLTLAEGPPVEVSFAPRIPLGTQIHQLSLNNASHPLPERGPLGLMLPPLDFTLDSEATIDLHHTGGVGAIPLVPHPAPGDASQGLRLIREALHGTVYLLTIEGPAGTTGRFQIKSFAPLARIDGADLVETSDDGVVMVRVAFDEGETAFLRKTVRFYLE